MPGIDKRGRGLSPPSPPQVKLGREGTGQRTGERKGARNPDGRRGQSHLEKSLETTGRPRWDREGVGGSWRSVGFGKVSIVSPREV